MMRLLNHLLKIHILDFMVTLATNFDYLHAGESFIFSKTRTTLWADMVLPLIVQTGRHRHISPQFNILRAGSQTPMGRAATTHRAPLNFTIHLLPFLFSQPSLRGSFLVLICLMCCPVQSSQCRWTEAGHIPTSTTPSLWLPFLQPSLHSPYTTHHSLHVSSYFFEHAHVHMHTHTPWGIMT